MHGSVGGSISGVLADLEAIWRFALEERVGLPRLSPNENRQTDRADSEEYYAFLVIPTFYDRATVSCLVDLLVRQIGFAAVQLNVEASCCAFGAGLPTACIADVGASKTCVACVEDGMLLPSSTLLLKYGGNDVTTLTNWLLSRRVKPFGRNVPLDAHVAKTWELNMTASQQLCHMDWVSGSRRTDSQPSLLLLSLSFPFSIIQGAIGTRKVDIIAPLTDSTSQQQPADNEEDDDAVIETMTQSAMTTPKTTPPMSPRRPDTTTTHQRRIRLRIAVPQHFALIPACVLFYPRLLECFLERECDEQPTVLRRHQLPLQSANNDIFDVSYAREMAAVRRTWRLHYRLHYCI